MIYTEPAGKKSKLRIPERWVKGACAMKERQSGKRQRPQFTKSPQPESEHVSKTSPKPNLPKPNSKNRGCQTTPTRACTHTCATALMLISSLEASANLRHPCHLAHSCTAWTPAGLQPPKPFCATSIIRRLESKSHQRHSTTAPTRTRSTGLYRPQAHSCSSGTPALHAHFMVQPHPAAACAAPSPPSGSVLQGAR